MKIAAIDGRPNACQRLRTRGSFDLLPVVRKYLIGLYFRDDRFPVSRYWVHPLTDGGCAMQIDHYNHLLFPRDSSNPATSGKQPAPAAIASALAQPQGVGDPARDAEGTSSGSVVWKNQLPDGAADAAVYSNGRKTSAPENQDADANNKALDHRPD